MNNRIITVTYLDIISAVGTGGNTAFIAMNFDAGTIITGAFTNTTDTFSLPGMTFIQSGFGPNGSPGQYFYSDLAVLGIGNPGSGNPQDVLLVTDPTTSMDLYFSVSCDDTLDLLDLTQGSVDFTVVCTNPNGQENADWNATSGVSEILNKPTLSTVATSGDYNDLINKPTITIIDAGKVTLSSGAFTVSETDILDSDIIQVTLQDISVDSGSSHIFSYSGSNIIENTSFDISSISYSTDGAIDTGDSSVVSYTVTRKS